jgi:hypothetical protein
MQKLSAADGVPPDASPPSLLMKSRKNVNQEVGLLPRRSPCVKSYAPHSTLSSGLATPPSLNMPVRPALMSTQCNCEGQSVLPAVSVHGTGFASMSFAVPLSDAEKRGTLPLLHFWRETVTSARSTPPNSVFR